jgi:hypothetical protein
MLLVKQIMLAKMQKHPELIRQVCKLAKLANLKPDQKLRGEIRWDIKLYEEIRNRNAWEFKWVWFFLMKSLSQERLWIQNTGFVCCIVSSHCVGNSIVHHPLNSWFVPEFTILLGLGFGYHNNHNKIPTSIVMCTKHILRKELRWCLQWTNLMHNDEILTTYAINRLTFTSRIPFEMYVLPICVQVASWIGFS